MRLLAELGDDDGRLESGEKACLCRLGQALVDGQDRVVLVVRALHGVDKGRAAWEIQRDQAMHFR